MRLLIKKLILDTVIHSFLLILLMICIQNSSFKSKVNLIFEETVQLPAGFIIGTSFISGSIIGSFLTINSEKKS